MSSSSTSSETPTQSWAISLSPTSSETKASPSGASSPSALAKAASITPTFSRSFSQSRSASGSFSSTASQETTQTQSPSLLQPGESRSATPSPSPTPTPVPYELVFVAEGGGTLETGALLLSDSLPPATLVLALNRCPGVPGQRTAALDCSTIADASPAGSSPLLFMAYAPSATVLFSCSGSDGGGGGVELPVSVTVLPPFGTPSFSATVSCDLTGADGSGMGSARQSVAVSATLWPTFDDVMIVSSNGFSRSIGGFGPGKVNSTAQLIAASAAASNTGRESARALSVSRGSPLGLAIASTDAVLHAMMDVWGGVSLPRDTAHQFALTLLGSTPFVLRSQQSSFVNGTSVRVGSLTCNGTVVSANGEWLATMAPDPALLCSGATASGGCAYAPLIVQNPSTETALGAALTCPPFCSGSVGGGIFPLAQSQAGSSPSFVPAARGSIGGFAMSIDLASAASGATVVAGVSTLHVSAIAASSGLFYSEACSDSGIYTDPSTGACTNASDPAFSLCAFGGGSACQPCFSGSICPGGFRAWPLPGYWSAAESSTSVMPCVMPDARGKCLGWSATLSAAQCGPKYRQGSFLCSGKSWRAACGVKRDCCDTNTRAQRARRHTIWMWTVRVPAAPRRRLSTPSTRGYSSSSLLSLAFRWPCTL